MANLTDHSVEELQAAIETVKAIDDLAQKFADAASEAKLKGTKAQFKAILKGEKSSESKAEDGGERYDNRGILWLKREMAKYLDKDGNQYIRPPRGKNEWDAATKLENVKRFKDKFGEKLTNLEMTKLMSAKWKWESAEK